MPLHVQETFVNADKGWEIGETDVYETYFETPGGLFKSCQREYGGCVSSIYIDRTDKPPVRIGWVFGRTERYEDTNEPYRREVWVTLHDAPDTVTREAHYHTL